uniref:Uncharacterized protein n=1 Tax=Anopheles merus TaxID=30066 RepID=A0A182UYN6_ANOME
MPGQPYTLSRLLDDKRHINILQVQHIYRQFDLIAEQVPDDDDDDDEHDISFETTAMSKTRHVKGVWKALADAMDAETSEEKEQLEQGVNLNTNPKVSNEACTRSRTSSSEGSTWATRPSAQYTRYSGSTWVGMTYARFDSWNGWRHSTFWPTSGGFSSTRCSRSISACPSAPLSIVSSLMSFDATIVSLLNHGSLNRSAMRSNVSRARQLRYARSPESMRMPIAR